MWRSTSRCRGPAKSASRSSRRPDSAWRRFTPEPSRLATTPSRGRSRRERRAACTSTRCSPAIWSRVARSFESIERGFNAARSSGALGRAVPQEPGVTGETFHLPVSGGSLMQTHARFRASRARQMAWGIALFVFLGVASAALGAATGKVQGKVVGTDTGEPIGFCDVALIPADTTQHPVGGMTNADGTFLLEAPAGRYTLQIRALSYATKRIEGIVVTAGEMLPFNTALTPQAIQQQEIVVEAKARQNTEASLLSARKKAAAVGDAVSAEQVRKSPDKNAADVLRRVTGLSVSEGKYVFVRGLGERYSSTEVDGVRIASPEQNKRVVPLDLLPVNLLDNITVQKTYTANLPGEFGGGDVQVRTKDFPGNRTWSFSLQPGWTEGVTLQQRATYTSSRADIFGYGASSREIPDEVYKVAGGRPLVESSDPARGFTRGQLADVAKSFENVWSPSTVKAIPNATWAATYGDEFKVLGRSLGFIGSGSLSRQYDHRDESQRFFQGPHDTL